MGLDRFAIVFGVETRGYFRSIPMGPAAEVARDGKCSNAEDDLYAVKGVEAA